MITMLIDHIGLIFFPETPYLRYIGRIAFPIYVYGLTQGYRYTSNYKKYMVRLLSIALLSQIPYSLAFVTLRLNVVFLLLFGLIALWILDHKKWYISLPLVLLLTFLSHYCSYGYYGMLLILIYRYGKPFAVVTLHLILNLIVVYLLASWGQFQLYSILGTLIILVAANHRKIKVHRTFYRYFYPAHLFLLFVLEFLRYGDGYTRAVVEVFIK